LLTKVKIAVDGSKVEEGAEKLVVTTSRWTYYFEIINSNEQVRRFE